MSEETLPFFFDTPESLQAVAAEIASQCEPPAHINLSGDLGAGKTTFVQGFLKGLGFTGAVKSPTYTYIERYSLKNAEVFHIDLYRADEATIETLELRDIFAEPKRIVLIEWPEKAAGLLPQPDLLIQFEIKPDGRLLTLV